MRLATITNWAYGATVALTLVSGTAMLLASNAQQREREAVEQRYRLDQATSRLDHQIHGLTEHARQYLNTGDRTYLVLYRSEAKGLAAVEQRMGRIRDAGANPEELATLAEAIRWSDALRDEQQAALAEYERGDQAAARKILFGPEYERELDRVNAAVQRFQDRLDRRTEKAVDTAAGYASLWKALSEIVLGVTALLFLCVLYFVFKRRVLRPVVKLSDVVNRLAGQDYATELPEISQIDEIGDMAQAIRVFRENGIERQRLEAQRETDQALRGLLFCMTQRMQSCDTLTDLQDVVRRFVPEIDPGRAGRLYLFDERRNAMVEACSWLEPLHSAAEFPPSACWALRRGAPHRPTGGEIDVPCQHLALEGAELPDSLCLPLTAQRQTIGLLYLEVRTANHGQPLTPDGYLTMLAENIGLALANLRLRDALERMAMTDPLTGLANRRNLEAKLHELHAGRGASEAPLSCLMIDVDHFKRFNDVFGHSAGDTVLREVGALLQRMTRDPDLAFRYGGEEFLVLLPDLDAMQAAARAEEIRERIGALKLNHAGDDLGAVTASIGVASIPEHGRLERLVPTADAALYKAKENGRDRVEVARIRQSDLATEQRSA